MTKTHTPLRANRTGLGYAIYTHMQHRIIIFTSTNPIYSIPESII